MDNDLCLVLLESPVTLNKKVQPISLPQYDEDVFQGSNIFIAGWGLTQNLYEGGQVAEVLQNALVRHVDDETCASTAYYGSQFNSQTMFCAG